jgi:alpha-tubulin suppressor-like RCC1 family protein
VRVRDLRATFVGAGHDSTCAVTTDGRVACWGALAIAERPRFVEGLPAPAVDVEVGQATACARLVDASVYCWGDGTHGQLGPAVRGASERPVRVEGLPPATTLEVAVTRACATDPDGQLWCWGAQEAGIADAGSPRMITHMSKAHEAAIASDATCARLARGGICCWGSNARGLIGAVIHPFSRPASHAELPAPMMW